jgi:putative tricarboxylic transport membrane protein
MLFEHLQLGATVALTASNILYCFIGVLLGTLVGVLPGLGPVPTIAMLLPLTFGIAPVSALVMLAGIYYGAQYGGSTTAILINIPGEPSSIITALDGHQMARQGLAGPALATSALGSFFAGTVSTLFIAMFAPPLANVALQFGAAEYFALMVLGLVCSVVLATGSLIKAVAMVLLGLTLGLIGQDLQAGMVRLNLGIPALADGVDFVAVAVGIFGVSEIVRNLESDTKSEVVTEKVKGLILTKAQFRRIIAPVLRGTGLGALLGVLPGGGAALSSFSAYALEKKLSRTPERFGRGAIEGVAAPESANNAGAQTSFIPMLTLGLPSNAVMALMMGAMIIQGIAPGPNVMTERPDLFWGLIVSMWVGNAMLVILNLPLIRLWVKLLSVPYTVLFPIIAGICCIGVYSINNNVFDVYVMTFFGVLGYVLVKLDCEPAPLLLGYILGPLLEVHMRRALLLSDGNFLTFFRGPISTVLLAAAAVLLWKQLLLPRTVNSSAMSTA